MIRGSAPIHVMHSQSLRTYLGSVCSRLLIIDPDEIWFEDTLQDAVILLAEKKRKQSDHSDGVGIVKVSGDAFLNGNPSHLFNETGRLNGKTVEGKWTRALLTASERELIDRLAERPDVHRFAAIADVDVGLVTGANKFFLVTDETVEKNDLHRYAHPMFGRMSIAPASFTTKSNTVRMHKWETRSISFGLKIRNQNLVEGFSTISDRARKKTFTRVTNAVFEIPGM